MCEGGLIVVEKNSTDRGAGVAYSAGWITCAQYFESEWTSKSCCVPLISLGMALLTCRFVYYSYISFQHISQTNDTKSLSLNSKATQRVCV
jgi:hypothetical protein